MSLTRLLIFRSIRARPLRMLLSTFGIVLGVAAILAIGITNQTALDSVTQLFANTSGKSNLVITNSDVEAGGFSENVLMKVQDLPGIARAVPSLQTGTLLANESGPAEIGLNFFGMDTGGLMLYGINADLDAEVRVYKIVEGDFLSKDAAAYEIVLVSTFAEENDLEVGDWAEIVAETGVEKLRLVGLMDRDGAGQLNNGAFGVIPLETAQKLFYRTDEIDQIDLMVLPELNNSEGIEEIRSEVQSALGDRYSVGYPASQGQRMTQMLSNYQIGLNFMSGIALFVGAFLIFNAFSMTVVERTREFGMLRTVGMTRSQVTVQVLLEAAMLGLFGSGLGVLLGIFMARGLTRLMEVMLAQDMTQVAVPQDVVILGATMGVIVALLIAAGSLPSDVQLSLTDPKTAWIILSCHLAMAIGTALGGWRIVRTMGMKITKLKPVGGFCAETAGAMTLFFATHGGIPVSTTHTITGSIVGVGSTRRLSAVRWGIAGRIVWAWILTIPAAAMIATVIFHILRAVELLF